MANQQTVVVIVPENHFPGSTMNVRTDDGRLFSVVIPPGFAPGQNLHIDIIDDAEGGATVSVAEQDGVSSNKAAIGVAAVGAVVGCLLVGPITGVVVGGAALYATTRDDNVGNAARSTGGAAVTVYRKTMEAAEKYHVKEKVVAASTATYEKAKDINEEYKVTDKVKAASKDAIDGAKRFNEKYDVTGNASRMLISGAQAASKSISKMNSGSSSSAGNTNSNAVV